MWILESRRRLSLVRQPISESQFCKCLFSNTVAEMGWSGELSDTLGAYICKIIVCICQVARLSILEENGQ
jgi:hypothetical protein